jgi:hypothetical protein
MRSMRHARAQLPLIATIAARRRRHYAAIIFAHAQLPGASLTRSVRAKSDALPSHAIAQPRY